MMKTLSKFAVFLASLTLTGCAGTSTIMDKAAMFTNPDNCMVDNDQLSSFLEADHEYLNANQKKRQSMIKSTVDFPSKQAVLLSNPEASTEHLAQSLKLFSSLSLLPTKNCVADRYLYLRFRHAQAQYSRQNRLTQSTNALKRSELQVTDLEKQIKALTDIEQSITRQRKEQ